jgi:hypothetical protein
MLSKISAAGIYFETMPRYNPLHPLPRFLKGRITQGQYSRWLDNRAHGIFARDKARGKAYARKASKAHYKSLIHLAVVNNGEFDPFTGERLAWELVGTWKHKKAEEIPGNFAGEFALMPTIDHKDPDALDFEICSWRVNLSKGHFTPREFISFCRRVVRCSSKNADDRRPRGPDFAQGFFCFPYC